MGNDKKTSYQAGIILFLLILSLLMLSACSADFPEPEADEQSAAVTMKSVEATVADKGTQPGTLINPEGATAEERIKVPEGFVRTEASEDSFAMYLRKLPLKPHGSGIKLYNGNTLSTDHHAAVIDMDVGKRDLQQCADSIMRLWSEYLYSINAFDSIHFNFTNGFKADFSTWKAGNSIKVEGNNVRWVSNPASTGEYASFRKYLDMVFSYAGTLSLDKELKQVDIDEMQPGDVFIEGGSPGHAVIVLDMATNEITGERIFILAQGYMPAQEMHILKNPGDNAISPWYSCEIKEELVTPQWDFDKKMLKRFIK